LQDLTLTANGFDPDNVWTIPLANHKAPMYYVNDLFDQNGYDLSPLEQTYAKKHNVRIGSHRETVVALRKAWFTQPYKKEGAVLNHALLFQRKGFAGAALEQVKEWAKEQPAYYKLVNIRPKWGMDFSIDYYDSQGNTFEVLHWEFDCFDYNEAVDKKEEVEEHLRRTDWDAAAKELLKLKEHWYHLDFFKQSDYKCNYFGIGSERWKMVVWK
jgi:hypothetical protein